MESQTIEKPQNKSAKTSQEIGSKEKVEKEKVSEKVLLRIIYQEMKKIAEEIEYTKQRQKKSKWGKIKLTHSIEREKLKPLRDRLIEKNPDQAELIFILVNLDRSSGWQFLTTHLFANNDDKKFAQSFWSQCEEIYKLFYPNYTEMQGHKRGVIGQVGIFKALKNIGVKPALAIPSQDALGVDLFVIQKKSEKHTVRVLPIQVKHGVSHTYKYKEGIYKKPKSLKIIPKQKIYFPSIVIDEPEVQTHIFSNDLGPYPHSEQDVKSRSKEIGKLVKSLKILCPPNSFDPDTGEPTPEFLKKFEVEIKKYI